MITQYQYGKDQIYFISFNPFTALPRVTLGVNTASYTPVPPSLARAKHGLNTLLFICM